MSSLDQYSKSQETGVPELSTLREYLCKLEPLRIPRPKCSGMEFVQTSGRQGFYLSLRRKEQKNGHTPLSAINFAPPNANAGSGSQTSINGMESSNTHEFEHRLNEATSGLSLTGNGRHHGDQQKAQNPRQPIARISA